MTDGRPTAPLGSRPTIDSRRPVDDAYHAVAGDGPRPADGGTTVENHLTATDATPGVATDQR